MLKITYELRYREIFGQLPQRKKLLSISEIDSSMLYNHPGVDQRLSKHF